MKLNKQLVSTDKALKPIRPYYSQAVSVEGAGRLLFISGQTWDPKLGGAAKGDAGLQMEAALEGMKAILEHEGGSMENVVKVTVYVRNIEDLDKVAVSRYKHFSKSPPSSTIVEVSKLFHPDLLVEIDAIAAF